MPNLLFWLCLLYPWKTLLFRLCTFDILHRVLIAEVYKMFLYQLMQCKFLFLCLLHLNPWFLIVVISRIIHQNYSQDTLQHTIILQTYPDYVVEFSPRVDNICSWSSGCIRKCIKGIERTGMSIERTTTHIILGL